MVTEMAARHRAMKASKGKVKPGIPGMQVMDEAVAPAHGFKKGGAAMKDCGPADGMAGKPRADRAKRKAVGGKAAVAMPAYNTGVAGSRGSRVPPPMPRGGMPMARKDGGAVTNRGRSPFSAAANIKGPGG